MAVTYRVYPSKISMGIGQPHRNLSNKTMGVLCAYGLITDSTELAIALIQLYRLTGWILMLASVTLSREG